MSFSKDSSRFFATQPETLSKLASRLFSDYQAKRPHRVDLEARITEIKGKIADLDSSRQPQSAVDLLWELENDIQGAYVAQYSIMRIANPSLFAKTLESLRDKIYSEYNQVDGFNGLLIQHQQITIPQLIDHQVAEFKNKKKDLVELVLNNKYDYAGAEEYGTYNEEGLPDETEPRKQVAEAENKLLVMQKASETFKDFVEAKKSAGAGYSR